MTTRRLVVALTVAALLLVRPAAAFHTVFDFSIDRFEADGNLLGPFDGSPDFVDEFDGTSALYWYTPYGTSSVSGGRLHVQSPGEHFPGPDGTTLDLTECASAQQVTKGYGDFTATAVFDALIPPEGHFYHFTLFTFGGGLYFNELFGIDIHTSGGETRIEQHLVILDLSHGMYETVQTEGRTITAAQLADQVHFRVAYDDDAGTVAAAFSLDGGVTFESPFAPAPLFTAGRTSAQFILGADPIVSRTSTTSSSTTTTTASSGSSTTTTLPLGSCERTDCVAAPRNRLGVRIRHAGQALVWAWRRGPSLPMTALGTPMATGGTRYALCVRDGTGERRVHAEVDAGGSCGDEPCWRIARPNAVAYRNGDADGLTALRLTASGQTGSEGSALAKGGALIGAATLTPPITIQLEADNGTCWGATFDASEVRTRGARRIAATTR